ncbi:MAG: hypothetical protein WC972_02490 [Trueperaceae bacterium]
MTRWTPADDEKLLRLYRQGMSLKDMAAEFADRTKHSVRHRGRRLGLGWQSVRRLPSKHLEAALAIIEQAPCTPAELGRKLGITRSSAWSVTASLVKAGKIHVHRYDDTNPGPLRPIYKIGPSAKTRRVERPTRAPYKPKTRASRPDPAAAWLFAPGSIDNE